MTVRYGDPLALPEAVLQIARTLEQAGHQAWCVGGALRDILLDHPQADVDLATSATPDQVQALFRRTVPVGIEFGTVGVLDPDGRLHEVTSFRRDVSTDGRRAVVAFGADLEDDLARRDFTFNAIAYHPLRSEWRDPFGGVADLEGRLLRTVGVPAHRFREDYLRILRGIRFAARFGLEIDLATWDAMCREAGGLRGLSAERVRDEWFKSLRTAEPLRRLVTLWHDTGAAAQWLPELVTPAEIASHAHRPRDPVVLTVHCCREPGTVLERLRGSRQEISRGAACGAAPRHPAGEDPVAVRQWMAEVGDAVDDLRLLARYTDPEGRAPAWEGVLAGVRDRGEAVSRRQLAVSGHDLAGAGIPAGPRMGIVLERLLACVLRDPAVNTRDRLLALARDLVDD